MNLERRTDWDGKVTLLLDGEVILERKSAEEVEEKAKHIEAYLLIGAIKKSLDTEPPKP